MTHLGHGHSRTSAHNCASVFPEPRGCILSSEHVERRLAAILAADVVGSCRLIGIDEEGTLAQLKALRKTLFDPKIAQHHGRVVKNTGDGALVEFASVVDAVRCADDVQRGMAEQNTDVPQGKRIEFRIGIHLGDIIIADDDIFGDGVNIAVRLEGIAEPGGICISDDAHREVRVKVESTLEDMGAQTLKNIAEPMRAWRVRIDVKSSALPSPKLSIETAQPLPLPDKPSIAVLPFQNMSGDPKQEYFADGMVEEIITALSRIHWLFVIARNSSFTYKGQAVDVKQVGRELGVRYVLEGSVRKSANRVRISAQLIDASTGVHLWADRFESALDDIFDLQDQVTASVVCAIAPKLEQAETARATRKPTESLDAYDYFLRGMASFHQWTREEVKEALRLFYRAIELDHDFGAAHGAAAQCYANRKANGYMTDRAQEIAEAGRLARRAVALSRDDAFALSSGGNALAYVVGDVEGGTSCIDRALTLNPNLAAAWYYSAWVRMFLGEPDVAIEHLARAIRLSPLDPRVGLMQTAMAFAHFFAGRHDEASSWADRAVRDAPDFVAATYISAASHALAGRLEIAQRTMARARQFDPARRISDLKDEIPLRRPQDYARLAE